MSEHQLPELPNGWESARLGDVAQVLRGVSYDKRDTASEPREGLIPLLRATNIGVVLSFDAPVYVPRTVVSDAQMLRRGDIVVAASSGSRDLVGKAAPLTTEWIGTFGAFCYVVRPHERIDADYVACFLASPAYRARISALSAGVNINNLRRGYLEDMVIPIPPRAEQTRIVKEITRHARRLHDGAAGFGEALRDIDAYESAAYAAAFSGELIGVDAAEWESQELGALVERLTSGSRDWKPYYGKGTGVFVMAQNVRPRSLDLSPVLHVDPPETDSARARSAIKLDDVLVTIVGAGTGTVARVPEEFADHWVCQSVALIRPKPPLSGAFLELFLNAPGGGRAQIEERVYGQGRPHLSFDDLRSIKVPLPSNDIQSQLVSRLTERLTVAVALREAISTAIQEHRNVQRALLARAFVGKLAQQDSSDEPASVLLEEMHADEKEHRPSSGAKKPARKTKVA
jgi:type I restriction enzyme S subunit